MKKIFKGKKSVLKTICLALAGVLVVGALVGLFTHFSNESEKTTKEISPSYAVGGLTATGTYNNTTGSIYTKNAFECNGLKTTLAFDNDISYKLFFYNEDNEFISATNALTASYNSSETLLPFYAKYCRIVITPNEDDNISWFEISNYSKQLKVIVDKNQNSKITELDIDFTMATDNTTLNGSGTTQSNTGFFVTDYVNVENYSQMYLEKLPIRVCFYDTNKTFISSVLAPNMQSHIVNIPDDTVYIRMAFGSTAGNSYTVVEFEDAEDVQVFVKK